MRIRIESQWHSLFEKQKASGLSITAFCRQHKLCSKNFAKRRKQLQETQNESLSPSFISVTLKTQTPPPMLELQHNNLLIKIPLSVSITWLNEFSPVVLFDYHPSRSQTVPLQLLEGFQGATQIYRGD